MIKKWAKNREKKMNAAIRSERFLAQTKYYKCSALVARVYVIYRHTKVRCSNSCRACELIFYKDTVVVDLVRSFVIINGVQGRKRERERLSQTTNGIGSPTDRSLYSVFLWLITILYSLIEIQNTYYYC